MTRAKFKEVVEKGVVSSDLSVCVARNEVMSEKAQETTSTNQFLSPFLTCLSVR